jgi:prepilin-type N-terminal cleavage/methylation domain-containing protein
MKNHLLHKNSGFSLVELLVVIALLGIIAAIAITNQGPAIRTANDSTDRRNAQEIARIASVASAYGADYVSNDKNATVNNLKTGVSASGNNGVSTFKLPPMSADRLLSAQRFLVLDQNGLLYSHVEVP